MRKVIIVLLFSGLLSGCGSMKDIKASDVSDSGITQTKEPTSSATSGLPEPKADTRAEDYSDSKITKVILLGTGAPAPDPNHSGCSVAIVVNDTPYIIDFGPGLIRQAAALSPKYKGSIKGLDVKRIKRAFLTHLHSDHTTGYPDLILTPWVMGRDEPLEVYGPEGIVEMTRNILKAYQEDIRYRLYGLEPANN